ncbi:MAG: hypothetical protein ACTSVI_06365 [Promethearchaeota archaeon]
MVRLLIFFSFENPFHVYFFRAILPSVFRSGRALLDRAFPDDFQLQHHFFKQGHER